MRLPVRRRELICIRQVKDLGKCASAEERITGVNLRIVIQAIKNESGLQAVPGDDMLGSFRVRPEVMGVTLGSSMQGCDLGAVCVSGGTSL